MKYILPLQKPHSVQNSLLTHPPKGYSFLKKPGDFETPAQKKFWKIRNKLSYIPLVKGAWEMTKFVHDPILKKFQKSRELCESYKDHTYNLLLSDSILNTEKLYWVDLEHVRQLAGWDIRLLKKNASWLSEQLAKDNCVLITSWTNAGINTVLDNLPNSKIFSKKCFAVHNAIPSVDFKRTFKKKKTFNFLFMSSFNLPYDFNFKGGNVVLEAFVQLVKKYPHARLRVKSWVPKDLLNKYQNCKEISFEGISPFSEMDAIFKDTDVFLSPNHNTPAQAYLDCMNYAIPVITTDLWANGEIIRHLKNGILIPPAKNVPYFVMSQVPNSRSPEFNRAIEMVDENLVKNTIQAASLLIEDLALVKKLGLQGKKDISSGEFSIIHRNEKYKRILDLALNRFSSNHNVAS